MKLDLEKIEDELQEISSFPWMTGEHEDDDGDHLCYYIHNDEHGCGNAIIADTDMGKSEERENAKFIAESPQRISELIEAVKKMREALEFYRDGCPHLKVGATSATTTLEDSSDYDGGEFARQCLKEIFGGEDGK